MNSFDSIRNGTTLHGAHGVNHKLDSLPWSIPARPVVSVRGRLVGEEQPVLVVAEIGINHNGSLELARRLIEGAARAGCDAVKFQKRTPELCVPLDQWDIERDTPWGRLSYIDYKRRVEFGAKEYAEIEKQCAELGLMWFASCWDEPSVEFLQRFSPPCYKAASASLTDLSLLRAMKATGVPLMISTGMSTSEEIAEAVTATGQRDLLIAHSTSTYPCPIDELNLSMIRTLKQTFPSCPIGYSGHESGLAPTWAAVALGATFIERHITLDREMWGTDHAASIELSSLERLVSQIRDVERAIGDGVKRVYDSEIPVQKKLRRVPRAVRSGAR
ncbi:MAG TPA: N-acetylneuraminate synthase family protein [Polyangiaceae bacterium]|jgi:N-acetylneuraminate synthase|nr:N-acetylneuraminate synthase family protein [Polyangiaceae bacterium]